MKIHRIILILLSGLFVFLSFYPSLYEIRQKNKLAPDRTFVLDHNYMFDFNFYLSRIRQGQDGKWLVSEKYYNHTHPASLIHIFYVYAGKIGGVFGLDPETIYHGMRVLCGFVFLLLISRTLLKIFPKWWAVAVFLLVISQGSWPSSWFLPDGSWRFGTYLGWWSVIDSLRRITFIPHVLIGQIFLLYSIEFIQIVHGGKLSKVFFRSLLFGILGLVCGIIFPPVLIFIYTYIIFVALGEIIPIVIRPQGRWTNVKSWFTSSIIPKIIFFSISIPSLIYLNSIMQIVPWSALAIFDIEHRITLPLGELLLSLGIVLPIGIIGAVLAVFKKDKKFMSYVWWLLTIVILYILFDHVPQQSPSRFTQMAIHVPLGILSGYAFFSLWKAIRKIPLKPIRQISQLSWGVGYISTVLLGLGVLYSMIGWQTGLADGKRLGSWVVPTGTQLIYPLKDFMDGIIWLRDYTSYEDVVLTYEASGNFIPAYGGNNVYLGHANTPNLEDKKRVAAKFFSGKMKMDEAKKFFETENIKYIYFGPQEKEIGSLQSLNTSYPWLEEVYNNHQVVIYVIPLH